MLKLAITGGIAAGKSAVCQIFQELGAYTVSLDQIVHQLLSSDTKIQQQVVSLLGHEILNEGVIDRKKVAKAVFTSPVLLENLENILHPRVQDEVERLYNQVMQNKLFVVEVPLLFETGMEGYYDVSIAVVADEKTCLERFCKRDEHTQEEFFQRMKRQLPPTEKQRRATFIINNSGSLQDLKAQVFSIYQQLTGV